MTNRVHEASHRLPPPPPLHGHPHQQTAPLRHPLRHPLLPPPPEHPRMTTPRPYLRLPRPHRAPPAFCESAPLGPRTGRPCLPRRSARSGPSEVRTAARSRRHEHRHRCGDPDSDSDSPRSVWPVVVVVVVNLWHHAGANARRRRALRGTVGAGCGGVGLRAPTRWCVCLRRRS